MATKRFMSEEITQGRALKLGALAAIAIAAMVVILTLTFWCDYSWRSPFAREDAHAAGISDVATPVAGDGGEGGASSGPAPSASGYGFAINVGPESGQASVAVDLPWAPSATSSDSVASASNTEAAAAASSNPSELDWFSSDGWKFLGWLVLLVAAAGLFWKIFEYLNDSRTEYYAEHEKLVNRGWIPQIVVAQTSVSIPKVGAPAAVTTFETGSSPSNFRKLAIDIEGPDRIEIEDSAIYTLKVAEGEKFPSNVRLEVDLQNKENVGAVRIYQSSQSKDTFVVVGVRTGKVELRVGVKGELQEKGLVIEVMPKAEPAPSKSVPLMVFGTGSHTLILGTLAVFVLLMITLSGAVDGAIVAPLIGTLIGYLFGVNSSSGGGEAKEKPTS